jgi:hypothetical protein
MDRLMSGCCVKENDYFVSGLYKNLKKFARFCFFNYNGHGILPMNLPTTFAQPATLC